MGKNTQGGSYKLHIDILSGVCDHQLDHCTHDNQIDQHWVLALGMVSLSAEGEGCDPDLDNEL